MPAASTLFRAARPAFRANTRNFFTSTSQSQQQAFRATKFWTKRWQSTAAGTNASGAGVQQQAQAGWLNRMWNSPIGLKTVHFWAPVMKWCIVIAGVSDFYRPAEKLSLTQNFALTCTGFIWTRWCFVIKPKNILLASVNFGLGIVGIIQVSRILLWRRSPEGRATLALEGQKKDSTADVKGVLVGVKEDIKDAVKS